MVPGLAAVRQSVVAAVRCAVLSGAVAAAMLGALTGPAAVTAAGVLLGAAVAAAAVHLAAWGLERDRPPRRMVVLAGTVGALVVPALSGLALLGPAGPALATALLLVGAPWPPLGATGRPGPSRSPAEGPPYAGRQQAWPRG